MSYRKGDACVILRNLSSHLFDIGERVEIVRQLRTDDFFARNDKGEQWVVSSNELELIPPPQTNREAAGLLEPGRR